MAKGQMRSNKEKKKPKQDKNKKDKGAAASPFNAGQGQPGQNPVRQEGSMRRRVTRGARIEASPRARPAMRPGARAGDATPTRRYSAAMILPAAE